MDSAKLAKLNELALNYPATFEEFDKFTDEEIRKAQTHFKAQPRNHHLHFEKVLEHRRHIRESSATAHRHYRDVGIGYTATIITLCIIQIKYIQDVYATGSLGYELKGFDFTDAVKLLLMLPNILCVLASVFAQFWIFNGYLMEARRKAHFNEKYFSPADKAIIFTIYAFFIGVFVTMYFVFANWSLLPIAGMSIFIWKKYRWRFGVEQSA